MAPWVEGPGVTGERGAFVGRFQPFHRGHHRVVRDYVDRFDDLVIVVGSSMAARTPRNPLSAAERARIIRACHPGRPIVFLPDESRGEAGYEAWANRLIDETEADVIITRNELVTRLVREFTAARTEEQPLYEPDRYSGTEIRRRIRAEEPWRDLVPECCVDEVARYESVIRGTRVESGD